MEHEKNGKSRSALGRRPGIERLEPRHLLATLAELPQIFTPTKDASIDDGVAVDADALTVRGGATPSTAYLAFRHLGFGGETIASARLRLPVAADAQLQAVEIHRGTGALWTERDLTAGNAPGKLNLLDVVSGDYAAGGWIEVDVTSAIVGSGIVNFVVSTDAATDDLALWSREGDRAPELVIVADGAQLPGDHDADGMVSGSDLLAWQRGAADQLGRVGWESTYGAPDAVAPATVLAYGAVPDDATSDRNAIQQALDHNVSVYLPAGEYVLDGSLQIPEGRRLLGPATGAPAVLRVVHDTGTAAGNQALVIAGDAVTVQDIVIDKDFVDGSYGVGIHAEGREDILIRGVEILDYSVRYGIHLIESDRFEIDDVYVHDFWMDDRDANGIGADMILDSPAGIRITRSAAGVIRDSRIHDIEVGPQGRLSISELVPSYGPQNYQSDGITLSDTSDVIVENNDLFNSGELLDVLVSDGAIVRNNTMQMGYHFGVKMIGSQDSLVEANYIADAAVGLWLGDHNSGSEATGNLILDNDFVNHGSDGIWNLHPSARVPFAISGINIDASADGNTVVGNRIYDYHGHLPTFIAEGSGINTVANNEEITDQFGPSGGDATIVSDWHAGLTRERQYEGLNRGLLFVAYAQAADPDVSATHVTYGQRALTKISERSIAGATGTIVVSTWFIDQDALNRARSGAFGIIWSTSVDSAAYASAFLADIEQTAPVFAEDTGTSIAGNQIATSPRQTPAGGLALYGAIAANPGNFVPENGFAEALELSLSDASASVGWQATDGSLVQASTTHDDPGVGAISMVVLQGARREAPAVARVDVTTLGVIPDDGLNDAVALQNALNNPAYDELYFPPGVYHVDRSLFVRSGKTVRGDHWSTTSIETLADVPLFRIDNNTTDATITNFTLRRPQTDDSDHEMIRLDNSDRITIDSVHIVDSPSRSPLINLRGGDGNVVRNVEVVNYQVVRDELSPEQPGLHTQLFGSGITLYLNTNFAVHDNRVIQEFEIDYGNPVIKGVVQASAIQIVNSSAGLVQENYIELTGQGIDTTGSSQLQVTDNMITECHSAGIKLVNGGHEITVEDNYITHCGLTGVWVSSGVSGQGGSYDNVVRNNTLVAIGQGYGEDFWIGNFAYSTPAAIHLTATQEEGDRVRNNVIIDNRAYETEELVGIVVAEPSNAGSPLPAIDNQIENNIEPEGPTPGPPLF